jgi:hypothetical protein
MAGNIAGLFYLMVFTESLSTLILWLRTYLRYENPIACRVMFRWCFTAAGAQASRPATVYSARPGRWSRFPKISIQGKPVRRIGGHAWAHDPLGGGGPPSAIPPRQPRRSRSVLARRNIRSRSVSFWLA